MTTPIKYIWDKNNLNTAPLSSDLQDNGYANSAIPGSAEFNELWRNISLLTAESFSTGDFRQTDNPHPVWENLGWIIYADGTIGSSTSGATLRADADTLDLYTMYWDTRLDNICPVSGGRGVSAAADFSANKTLGVPPNSGRVFCNVSGSTYAPSESFGSNLISLSKENLAKHTHTQQIISNVQQKQDGGGAEAAIGWTQTGITGDGTEDGLNGTAHENRQPTVTTYFFIKL